MTHDNFEQSPQDVSNFQLCSYSDFDLQYMIQFIKN